MDYYCPGGNCAYHYTYPDNPYGAQKFRYQTGEGYTRDVDPFWSEYFNPWDDGPLLGQLLTGQHGPNYQSAAVGHEYNCGEEYHSYMSNHPLGQEPDNHTFTFYPNMIQKSHWNWHMKGIPAMYFRAQDYNPCGSYGPSPSLQVDYEVHIIGVDEPDCDNDALILEWAETTFPENPSIMPQTCAEYVAAAAAQGIDACNNTIYISGTTYSVNVICYGTCNPENPGGCG